jgi:hypothetical protein
MEKFHVQRHRVTRSASISSWTTSTSPTRTRARARTPGPRPDQHLILNPPSAVLRTGRRRRDLPPAVLHRLRARLPEGAREVRAMDRALDAARTIPRTKRSPAGRRHRTPKRRRGRPPRDGEPSRAAAIALASRSTPGPAPAVGRAGPRALPPAVPLSPAKNWTNDPNGLVFLDGEYHLSTSTTDFGDKWGHMSWGHAVSRDLVTWEHHRSRSPGRTA